MFSYIISFIKGGKVCKFTQISLPYDYRELENLLNLPGIKQADQSNEDTYYQVIEENTRLSFSFNLLSKI